MSIHIFSNEQEFQEYDAWLRHQPQGNFWQSVEHKAYAETLGKNVRIYACRSKGTLVATAQVVIDTTRGNLSVWEIPRGPVWDARACTEELQELLNRIVADAQEQRCIALYYSPQLPLPQNAERRTQNALRLVHSTATRIIDLTPSEEEIFAQMKPKCRYNIRLARKHEICVELSEDVKGFIELVHTTAKRDGFRAVRDMQYTAFYEALEQSFLVTAFLSDQPSKLIAGLLGVLWNNQAIYYYGASDHAFRALMAPYLVQWKAICHSKNQGAHSYDLLGVAPADARKHHPWAGITEFKEKFGGRLAEYPEEQMVVLRPWAMQLLTMKRKLWR